MRRFLRISFTLLPLVIPACPVMAQQPAPVAPPVPAQTQPQTPPQTTPQTPQTVIPVSASQTTKVAATVNGQNITEAMVNKLLVRVPTEKRAEVRGDIIDHLVENTLIDQYVNQQQVKVDAKEIDAKIDEMKAELKKQNVDWNNFLRDEVLLSEVELRELLAADMRWTKFSTAQASDKAVQDMFTSSKEMFDGTQVHVRHILINGEGPAVEAAKTNAAALKKSIEATVAAEVAKLPPTTDALTKEKFRTKAVEDAFAAVARDKSTCPSKDQGGDVGWFQRVGIMVEPFAKAAFAMKPYDVSEPVVTPFGVHLILLIERKPGRDIKFEDVKEEVRDIYRERLRQQLLTQLKASAKIVVNK